MNVIHTSPAPGQQAGHPAPTLRLHGHPLGGNMARAAAAEAAGTFVLVLVIIAVATDPRVPRGIAALAIGATLAVTLYDRYLRPARAPR